MKPKGSGTYGEGTTPTEPMLTRVQSPDTEQPTMVKCPTCAGASPSVGKLGCQTCVGAGYITYERYFAMTQRCPTCVGTGRVTNDQADALNAEAKRREKDR